MPMMFTSMLNADVQALFMWGLQGSEVDFYEVQMCKTKCGSNQLFNEIACVAKSAFRNSYRWLFTFILKVIVWQDITCRKIQAYGVAALQ